MNSALPFLKSVKSLDITSLATVDTNASFFLPGVKITVCTLKGKAYHPAIYN